MFPRDIMAVAKGFFRGGGGGRGNQGRWLLPLYSRLDDIDRGCTEGSIFAGESGWLLFLRIRTGWPGRRVCGPRIETAKHKTRRYRRWRRRRGGGGEGGVGGERGGRRERAGGLATSPRKSRVMPTRNCTTPRTPLPASLLSRSIRSTPFSRPLCPRVSPSPSPSLVPSSSRPPAASASHLPISPTPGE